MLANQIISNHLNLLSIPIPSGWIDVFNNARPELELLNQILTQLGEYFPSPADLFKAFELCPLENVRVVILGQDPYHSTHDGFPQANGLAFSTNHGCPIQPSLSNIYKELKKEYPDFKIPTHGDLSAWAIQGVLLLNTCLTVKPHQAKSHKEIWNGFIAKILDSIGHVNPVCIYLLWGAQAQNKQYLIGERSITLNASHPSPFSAYKASRDSPAFMGCGHFRKVNEFLEKQGKPPINWQL